MEKKPIEIWVNEGKKNCKSYVFYQKKVLDLSQFIVEHPGGVKAIKDYVYKDITNIIFQVFHHNKQTTIAKMMKYQVGFIHQNQVTEDRQKINKTPVKIDQPKQINQQKQIKKVFYTAQNQKPMENSKRFGKSKASINKSVSKNKQNLKQSTAKTNASKQSNKSKSKKKQNLTSIRIINQDQSKSYEDYYKQNVQKIKQKSRQQQRALKQKRRHKKQTLGSCSYVNNQLDQQKPNFRVPILNVKHMQKNG